MAADKSYSRSRYLTYSDRDRNWEVYATCVGESHLLPGSPYPLAPEDHPEQYLKDWAQKGRSLHEFQVHYISSGEGVFTSRITGEIPLEEGSIFLLFPGISHWYSPLEESGWHGYYIGFLGPYPERLLTTGFIDPEEPVFHVGLHASIIEDFQEALEIAERQLPGFQVRLGSLVMTILARTLSYNWQKHQGSETELIIERARAILEDNIKQNIDIHDVSADLGIDYYKFRHLFKEYTGLSPYQYFLQLKINKAKILLEDLSRSVKEIAYDLNFENPYYFSRMFKKKTGVSPQTWREERNA
jgi:AraC-like DNA-binding protein